MQYYIQIQNNSKIAHQGTPYWHLHRIIELSISISVKCAWNRACYLMHIWMQCPKGDYVGRGRILLRKLRTLILDFLPFPSTHTYQSEHPQSAGVSRMSDPPLGSQFTWTKYFYYALCSSKVAVKEDQVYQPVRDIKNKTMNSQCRSHKGPVV